MLCDNCRERESKINFTTVEQDTKVTLHLCEQCAQQKGIETGEACPRCGRPLVKQYSKKTGQEFVGCPGWKEKENPCKYIKPREGEPERPEPVETEIQTPQAMQQETPD